MHPSVSYPVFMGGGPALSATTRDYRARVSAAGGSVSNSQLRALDRMLSTIGANSTLFKYFNPYLGGVSGILVPVINVQSGTGNDTNTGIVAGAVSDTAGIALNASSFLTTTLTRANSLVSAGVGYGCAFALTGGSTEIMGVLGSGSGAGRVLLNPNFSGSNNFHNIGDSNGGTARTSGRVHASASAVGVNLGQVYYNGAAVGSTFTPAEIAAGGTVWAVGRGPNAIGTNTTRLLCSWVTTHTSAAQWAILDAAIAQFLADIGRS
jgi:hypothetical protein